MPPTTGSPTTPADALPAWLRSAFSGTDPQPQQQQQQGRSQRQPGSSGPGGGDTPSEPEEDLRPWPSNLPTTLEGINWWCYTVLGLLFITDYTPFGALLLQPGSRNAGLWLAAMQWGVFVAPTVNWVVREKRWDAAAVFRLRGCSPGWLAAGVAAGSVLWLVTAAAISARTGTSLLQLSGAAAAAGGGAAAAAAGAAAATAAADAVGASPLSGLLFGELLQRPGDVSQWALVLLTSALSPAVAEELLYRGLLLTALQQRLGGVDAVAVGAALFAAAHLSIPQFFAFTLLGFATGALALRSGSVLPAVAAHAAYNATGIAVGLAVALAAGGGTGAGAAAGPGAGVVGAAVGAAVGGGGGL
ncbi:hypothetical protein HYH02_013545 [Chlamydomonas schloesseri]|uniref:CAAX prenyl protease 2/Lysostaphin resistance protein A-like domain-containing protein n=1 Tax=Chlamydomonas schloesseri TaxID=2026947 RepID=A0A835T3N9_9CHLO|nr:hypothetical protein HYH02_013545 [Chlamydomonas schloesseri]|eukprot:KAG2431016.1 hypothetical protein HYH02_013545 [Chlamydomonas schloesseri]